MSELKFRRLESSCTPFHDGFVLAVELLAYDLNILQLILRSGQVEFILTENTYA